MIEVKPEDRIHPYQGRTFPAATVILIVALILAGGATYWYYAQQRQRFESVYAQLEIPPLPLTLEWHPSVQSRLDQLKREPCYKDAIVNLAGDLLEAAYPREAAIASRSFVKRCGGAREVLPLAYEALERVNDFAGALDVANQLVEAAPGNASVRYWRAAAYEQTGDFPHALNDYMNTLQLVARLRDVDGDAFYKLSQIYEKLGRPCDAITPIEMYVSLDPATRRTPQTDKIVSDYAAKGGCASRFANGTARVAFAADADVHVIPVSINGAAGNFIVDTGASFVAVTAQFSSKAKIVTEAGNQITIQSAGGRISADIGYANSVRVGGAEATGVIVAVDRNVENPFGARVDGLLGMSFLSRFNVNLRPSGIELTAIQLK